MQIVDLIGKALSVRAFYHKVISGNIANAQTPGYKEKEIDFRRGLDGAPAPRRDSLPQATRATR